MYDFETEIQNYDSVESWLKQILYPQCTDCTVSVGHSRRQVDPRGPLDSPIVFVGEAPGRTEEEYQTPFVGDAGKKLEATLAQYGISTQNYYVTNTVKCKPLDNKTPIAEECKTCRNKFLKHEIGAYPRKLIVALGNIGYYGVVPKGTPSGIMSRTGIFEWNEEFQCHVLPCIHPAAVLRDPSKQSLLDDACNKLAAFIERGYALEEKHETFYRDIRTLSDLDEFIKEVNEKKVLCADIESTGFNYFKDKILCISFSTAPYTAWYLPIIEDGEGFWDRYDWEEIQEKLRGIFEDRTIRKIGHNLKFDFKFLICSSDYTYILGSFN